MAMNTSEVLFQFDFNQQSTPSKIYSYNNADLYVEVEGNCPTLNDDVIGNSLSMPVAPTSQTEYKNYLLLPSFSASNPIADLTKGITVCAWIKFNSFQNYAPIICFGNSSGLSNFAFQLNTTTGCIMTNHVDQYGNQYRYILDSSDVLEIDKWCHVAVTIDSQGNPAFYVNGVEKSNTKQVISAGGTTSQDLTNFLPGRDYLSETIKIGASNFDIVNAMPLDANLGWLSMYRGALTQTQVQEDMSIRKFAPVPSLFEFDFASEQSNIIEGVSPNALKGTLSTSGCEMTSDPLMGKCLKFLGTGSMSLGSVGATSDFQTGMTITSWVNLKNITTAGTFLELAGGTASSLSDSFSFGVNATGNLTYSCFNSGGSNVSVVQKEPLNAQEWVHIAITIDSVGTSTLYVDGNIVDQANAIQPAGLLPTSIARTVNTVGTDFEGDMAWLALYNGCLNISQINEDFQSSADNRASTFQNTTAVGFKLYSNYYGSEVPALFLVDSASDNHMTLEVSSNSLNKILLPTLTSKTPSLENYHFQLRFKPGVLSENFVQEGVSDTSIWNFKVDTISSTGHIVISFICLTAGQNLTAGTPLTVEIPKVNGNPFGGARSTNVEFLYKLQESISTDVSLDISGHALQSLNIISHIGNRTSPLTLHVVGPARVLNYTPETQHQSIKLRLFNSSTTESIQFYNESEHASAKFQINLPVQNNLGILDEMALIAENMEPDVNFGHKALGKLGVSSPGGPCIYVLEMTIKPDSADDHINQNLGFIDKNQCFLGPKVGEVAADGTQTRMVYIEAGIHFQYEDFKGILQYFTGLEANHVLGLNSDPSSSYTPTTKIKLVSPNEIKGYFCVNFDPSGLKQTVEIGDLVSLTTNSPEQELYEVAVQAEKGAETIYLTPAVGLNYSLSSNTPLYGFYLNKYTKTVSGQWDLSIAQTELAPQDSIDIEIKGIVTPTNSISGQSYVNLVISNLNNYWQQNFNIPIEKTPLILGDDSVAIGTDIVDSGSLFLLNPAVNTTALQIGEIPNGSSAEGLIYVNPPADTTEFLINIKDLFTIAASNGDVCLGATSTLQGNVVNGNSGAIKTLTSDSLTVKGINNTFGKGMQYTKTSFPSAGPYGLQENYAVVIGAAGGNYPELSGSRANEYNLLLALNDNVSDGDGNEGTGDVGITFISPENHIRYTPGNGFTYNLNTPSATVTGNFECHQFNGRVKMGNTKLDLIKDDSAGRNIPLHIGQPTTFTELNGGYMFTNSATLDQCTVLKNPFSVLSEGPIAAPQFMAISDVRVKQDLEIANPSEDYTKIQQLQIKNYKYRDSHLHGDQTRKGLIAQEVEKIFPQAVTHHQDFIPDFYAKAKSIVFDKEAKTLLVNLDKEYDCEIGDVIKVATGTKEVIAKVSEVLDNKSFVLENWAEETTQLFVIGKRVDDFRTVDYDQVAMLGISAMKELGNKVERLEKLEKENEKLRKKFDEELTELKEQIKNLTK